MFGFLADQALTDHVKESEIIEINGNVALDYLS